eukprot:CAMPEP_0116964046 /NCGR_PEP_ID=MMETSP0467-20121206/48308_1 /TAXON_ID=283647 /ORGANISM="Mesodinium pulex, Strain SPMC105" /LENGTH=153 /DNA_ID=CAMNT_0004652861 /DNA_START=1416 /DNA_END=1877 /DNA_ORIENTATION=-
MNKLETVGSDIHDKCTVVKESFEINEGKYFKLLDDKLKLEKELRNTRYTNKSVNQGNKMYSKDSKDKDKERKITFGESTSSFSYSANSDSAEKMRDGEYCSLHKEFEYLKNSIISEGMEFTAQVKSLNDQYASIYDNCKTSKSILVELSRQMV